MILREIYVENFKSLKKCRIRLEKFNVVVGPNASGKSNLAEIFKLLRKVYVERADNPFTEWWGYRNVVSDHKEELPIKISLKFEDNKDKDKYKISYDVEISGTGGQFEIIKEVFEVEKLRIERTKREIIIKYQGLDEAIIDNPRLDFLDLSFLNPEFYRKLESFKENLDKEIKKYSGDIIYNYTADSAKIIDEIYKEKDVVKAMEKENKYKKEAYTKHITYLSNTQTYEILQKISKENLFKYYNEIFNFLKNTIILKEVNITEIKPPINPTKNITLAEDGRNIVNVIYNLFLENGQVPDGIKTLLSYIFPNTYLIFKLTDDGRILMEISENDLVLLPPSISVGCFKFLTIITALELKPSLIVIDELENSLYPKAIELIMDEFKNEEGQVIITTHSPVVVDLVYPDIKDLILVKKENGESSFINIGNEEKIRNELDVAGIILSEKWLYGRIDKYSKK